MPYETRLKRLKLFPLKERRARGDMITTYKLVNGLIDANTKSLVPILAQTIKRDMRSHDSQIQGTVSKTNMRKYFFLQRIVLPWNTLSKETVNSPTVESFKARYDKERLSEFIYFFHLRLKLLMELTRALLRVHPYTILLSKNTYW